MDALACFVFGCAGCGSGVVTTIRDETALCDGCAIPAVSDPHGPAESGGLEPHHIRPLVVLP